MGRFNGIELDDVELAGKRLLLRRWRPDDAGAVFEIMQDRTMYEWLALPDPYSRDAADAFVTSIGQEGRGEGRGLGCAVVERLSGEIVGSAALRLAAGGELGYWVRPSSRGRGYAAEAVRLLDDWAFAADVRRVFLHSDVRNLGSVRVALAAGFRFEGVQRGQPRGRTRPRIHRLTSRGSACSPRIRVSRRLRHSPRCRPTASGTGWSRCARCARTTRWGWRRPTTRSRSVGASTACR